MLFYSFGIYLAQAAYRLAVFFNRKARLFHEGRRDLWSKLATARSGGRWIWVHCASLGEFEQGRPVIEALRREFPGHRIALTFFSPSGYEMRKDYDRVDLVTYLPWDTPINARRFVRTLQPELAIFVKYEFWLNYLRALNKYQVPIISISTILRPEQIFFTWYGALFRRGLRSIRFFFTQNDETVGLLQEIGISAARAVGDTRFDRVVAITAQAAPVPIAGQFKSHEPLLVVGSCWHQDMAVLLPFLNEQKIKCIIAPHEMDDRLMRWIEKSLLAKSVRLSVAETLPDLSDFQVLIVDRIGLLSRLYRYGNWAYVGGAFGRGVHNILEAASYGIPVFFGNRSYQKFREAVDLLNQGGAFAVGDFNDVKNVFEKLKDPDTYTLACAVNKSYVERNQGATAEILAYCKSKLAP